MTLFLSQITLSSYFDWRYYYNSKSTLSFVLLIMTLHVYEVTLCCYPFVGWFISIPSHTLLLILLLTILLIRVDILPLFLSWISQKTLLIHSICISWLVLRTKIIRNLVTTDTDKRIIVETVVVVVVVLPVLSAKVI